MAATATQQIIHNGTRNLVLKYTIAGTSGDVISNRLVDVSALDSNIGDAGLRLERATWSLTGFSCKLAWDGGPDTDLLELSDGDGEVVSVNVENAQQVKLRQLLVELKLDGAEETSEEKEGGEK